MSHFKSLFVSSVAAGAVILGCAVEDVGLGGSGDNVGNTHAGGSGSGGSGGSAGSSSGGSGGAECASDADCTLGNSCCACEALAPGEQPTACAQEECFADACSVEGVHAVACEAGQCVKRQMVAETCNGLDDDLDGVVDDGASCPAGSTCRDGACVSEGGQCVASSACHLYTDCCNCLALPVGVLPPGCPMHECLVDACTAAGVRGVECSAGSCVLLPGDQDAGSACGAEACNGIDDDCDGTVDNGVLCPAGQVCSNGACL